MASQLLLDGLAGDRGPRVVWLHAETVIGPGRRCRVVEDMIRKIDRVAMLLAKCVVGLL